MLLDTSVFVSGAECPVCLNVSDHVKVRGGGVLCTICSSVFTEGDTEAFIITDKEDDLHPISPRADMLREAERIVDGDRNNQYGDPNQDFGRTAAMWGAYLGVEIQPHDVGAMMALLKVSRIRWSPEKRDSWVDLAGYAACGYHCTVAKEDSDGN